MHEVLASEDKHEPTKSSKLESYSNATTTAAATTAAGDAGETVNTSTPSTNASSHTNNTSTNNTAITETATEEAAAAVSESTQQFTNKNNTGKENGEEEEGEERKRKQQQGEDDETDTSTTAAMEIETAKENEREKPKYEEEDNDGDGDGDGDDGERDPEDGKLNETPSTATDNHKDDVKSSSSSKQQDDEKGSSSKQRNIADSEKEEKEDDISRTAAGTNGASSKPESNANAGVSNATSASATSADIDNTATNKSAEKSKPNKKPKKAESEKTATSAPSDTAASDSTTAAAANASSAPPPPVMKGTLSYDLVLRRHLIRGMWNYEHSTVFPPQRFELLRTLGPEEDPTELPKDGEFHGSFSLAYFHTTSKGKQKERSKVIPESGVQINFTLDENGEEGKTYKVDGKGTNQFGVFHVNGSATPSTVEGDPTWNIILSKRYEPAPTVVDTTAADATAPSGVKKSDGVSVTAAPSELSTGGEAESGPLPPPSKSFPSGVVCLRGKLYKEESAELGLNDVIHRINGMWSSGLDVILADPQNVRGLCNRFEYEHKSSVPSNAFPVSGRYSGWFDLSNDDGSRTRINERDVTLKFRPNNAGYHNVEGKGSNVFGKYSITGTLTMENVITIFRHFQPRKLKSKAAAAAAPAASVASGAPGPATVSAPAQPRRPSTQAAFEPKLKLDDVKLPTEAEAGKSVEPVQPPLSGAYSAVSRGVLRVNDDGSHVCNGKWAITREHFTNNQTSVFTFRLESHLATEAAAEMKNGKTGARQFPVDSAFYKGTFALKKPGSTRFTTIVDDQVVMKFCMNSQGSYNVYGRGVNAIGIFNLVGTLVMAGKTSGQVELYRMYPPELLTAQNPPAAPKTASGLSITAPSHTAAPAPAVTTPVPLVAKSAAPATVPGVAPVPLPPLVPLPSSHQRRESTRLVKLPSKLEDDDPTAQLSRVMQKCQQILRLVREKDEELGAFFGEPVDPVALGIPTYHQVIKEPMDLRTIHRRMEAGNIETPDEFCRLVRLVFENAMTFNVDPAHSVHQAARTLLVLFNQKFRDVERMLPNIRRTLDVDDKGKKKVVSGKEDKKRKRTSDEQKSLKRIRLEEAQQMAASNANAVAAIVAAAPASSATTVTRAEFNMLLNLIQQLQKQVVLTHTAVAELSPGDETTDEAAAKPTTVTSSAPAAPVAAAPAPAPERKKAVKRKSLPEPVPEDPAPVVDENRSLTLEEQEQLTETINDLPPEHLGGVIQIIREAAPVGADEDEIDLEIDQLDTKTQRKLLRHVSKVRTSFLSVDMATAMYLPLACHASLSRKQRLRLKRSQRQLQQEPRNPRRLRLERKEQPLKLLPNLSLLLIPSLLLGEKRTVIPILRRKANQHHLPLNRYRSP